MNSMSDAEPALHDEGPNDGALFSTQIDRVCIIGCGNMGGACLSGWIATEEGPAKALAPNDFVCVATNEAHRRALASEHGVTCVDSASRISAFGPFDLILLGVKPQVLPSVLEELSATSMFDEGAERTPLVLSIAAGIATSDIERALPGDVRVVRAMPNMPLKIGKGATAICAGAFPTEPDMRAVEGLFSALGAACIVEEGLIDAVCAISGGGPAYVAYMIEALRDSGCELGIDRGTAELLALETVGGTYEAMKLDGAAPEEMRESVCSPGGTTLAALASFDSNGFKPMFSDAMHAAVSRAAELRGEG